MAKLSKESRSTIECRCGCGQSYPFFSGWLEYGESSALAFRAAHFVHSGQAANFWLLLGTGPWITGEDTGCWAILKSWVDDDNLILKVEDVENSPFNVAEIFGERFLRRDEVFEQDGGFEWAIKRRDEILQLHQPSAEFLNVGDVA